jgi:broad specificity phosphatase PhoE
VTSDLDQPDADRREPAKPSAEPDVTATNGAVAVASVIDPVAEATVIDAGEQFAAATRSATTEPVASSLVDAGAHFAAAAGTTSQAGGEEAPEAAPAEDEAPEPVERAEGRISTAERVHDGGAAVETIVHVLRHGEVHNPNGILYGRLPGFSLSVTGRAQAAAVARTLADHDIALVIASPLQRAQETAEPIAAQHDVIVRTDENLIEAGNTFEGLRVSVGDGALRKPRHWWKLRDPFTPSWGEPYLQIAHRMLAAVNKARVEAAGREAVLVSHQLPVWTLRRFLQGQRLWHDPRQRQCSLASLTSLVYHGDTLVDIVYSEPPAGSDPSVHGA